MGACACVFEEFARIKWNQEIPSMAFGMGTFLPPAASIGALFGNLAKIQGQRWYRRYKQTPEEKRRGIPWETLETALCSAAMLTGMSMISLLVGISMNFDENLEEHLNINLAPEPYEARDDTNP